MPDLTPMATRVAVMLKERGDTIAVAESAAGGLISAALLSVPGASAYFVGGGVIYTRDARSVLLGLSDEQVTMRGATEEYVLLGARTIRQKFGATWGLAESGASGPTGNRYGDDAGHVCAAVSGPVERAITVETGSAEREANMWTFAEAALELLVSALEETR